MTLRLRQPWVLVLIKVQAQIKHKSPASSVLVAVEAQALKYHTTTRTFEPSHDPFSEVWPRPPPLRGVLLGALSDKTGSLSVAVLNSHYMIGLLAIRYSMSHLDKIYSQ